MQERRKFIRYDTEGSVVLEIKEDVSRVIKGDLVDVSFMGMSVCVWEEIPENTFTNFELITKLYDKPIMGEGKIIYIKEIKQHDVTVFRIGIDFTRVDNEAIRYILARLQEDICAQAKKKKLV